MTSPMDDALRRTTHAVERYGVSENMIALAAETLMQMPAEQRAQAGIHAMVDAVLLIADEHGGPHPECDLCQSISNGLAVAMGVIRAETDVELRRMFDSNE